MHMHVRVAGILYCTTMQFINAANKQLANDKKVQAELIDLMVRLSFDYKRERK